MKRYTWLWLALSLALCVEYLLLKHSPQLSFSHRVLALPNLSPAAGRPISLFLGWSGLGIMCLTNLYVIRKRLRFLRKAGNLSGWLDFHIFCGLWGPTLVIFHTDFKVRGLVMISFWCMVIVAVSGIVGRYFYLQILKNSTEFEKEAQGYEKVLSAFQKQNATRVSEAVIQSLKTQSLAFVGAGALVHRDLNDVGFLSTFVSSFMGDVRSMLRHPPFAKTVSPQIEQSLIRYALARRHHLYYSHFQRYLGYWHSFHMPFAFFMYLVAAIHVASALLFGVKG